MKNRLTPREIFLDSPHSFTLVWSDGKLAIYSLSDLQRRCPCTLCKGQREKESSRNPSLHDIISPKPVRGIRLKSIGRYGLKIEFAEGCSKGIYSYTFLRALMEVEKGEKASCLESQFFLQP